MNTFELLCTRLGILAGIVLVVYSLYRLLRLLVSQAGVHALKANGKFRQEGLVKYNLFKDNYAAYDLTKDFADQLTGEIYIGDDGKAWLQVRKDDGARPDSGFEKLGYIDLKGNIYDRNHCLAGYVGNAPGQPDMTGRRKWYELFLRCHANVYLCARQEQVLTDAGNPDATAATAEAEAPRDRCIGKCIETGRFRPRNPDRYTALGRSAAFLLLYRQTQPPKPAGENLTVYRYAWSDTALISAFLFAVLYALFYLFNVNLINMPFLGDWIVLLPTAFYFPVWALVRQVKIEQSLSGKPVEHFLMLFNRNTGLAGMNNLILLFALAAVGISVFVYGRDLIPFQMAILIGAWVNGKYITRMPWTVYDRFLVPQPDARDDEEEDTAGMIARNYRWELDADETRLQGELNLYFAQDEINELRSRNPFRTDASLGFDRNIETLFREKTDERHLRRINRYISTRAFENGLGGLETMQFILDFVQEPNIRYLADEASPDETGGVEYARFPVETLFDRHGDCDCKAVLAAALFRNAGYRVAYITSRSHAAIAVACPKEWFSFYHTGKLSESGSKALIDKDGLYYYFCETTGDSFRIGDCGANTPEEFTEFRFLK
ncbi:MAG: hypothetical protein LBT76_03985 [Tannerella sp.]|jgi:hypothetical protein|nr:hypothetical protein [Tannerella sp.]